jgi:acetolactate synthase-1/2/3 large subunit
MPAARRMGEYVDNAFRIALSGVPCPVYLEAPLDLLMEMVPLEAAPRITAMNPPRPGCDEAALQAAVALLEAAERPCFIVGSELCASPRRDAIRQAADSLGCPFYLNGQARGALGPGHPALFAASRRHALGRSDLVVVLGTPLDFRLGYGQSPTWNPEARMIQVDIDPVRLGHNRTPDVAIQSDVGIFLEALAARLPSKKCQAWLYELGTLEAQRRAGIQAALEVSASPPSPLRVCHELSRRLGKRDIVIGDGGDFVATAAHTIGLEWPQLWMDPGPLGTLGVGPGYALAASLARPDARVVIVFGDGAFGLNAMEFEALARHGCNVVAVIGNDAAWTQIRRGQVQLYGEERAVATRLEHSRYHEVVQALGGKGYWVERSEELGPALDGAFAAAVPSCVNVKIAPSDFRSGAISV